MSTISPNNGAKTPNVLCLASYEKGHRFLTEAKKLGWRVYLMTSDRLRDAGWPRESIDDMLCMPGDQSDWNLGDMLVSIAGLCRHVHLDRVVALEGLFGLKDGASHTEFIRSRESDEFLFLETSARVGGAHIAELIEAGTGVSLWTEWAKLKSSIITGSSYSAPEVRNEYAGLLVSLARQDWPDTSVFSDPEVVWKLVKRHHASLVVRSPDDRRVAELIDSYTDIVRKDFHATAPPREKVGY
jgi:hypothetical protein